jgi:hypothetical protein
MSIGSLGGVAGSAAGSPLAQMKGSEVERAEQETAAQKGHAESDRKAEAAAGIGQADGEDHEPAERDADGRRPWERPTRKKAEAAEPGASPEPPQSKDAAGQSGTLLDLSG